MTATERDAVNRLSYRRQIAAALAAVNKLTSRIEVDYHDADAMPADLVAVLSALDQAADMVNEAAAELAAPDV